MELAGKHVLVIGLGETGLAASKWLARQGARVRVVDSRETASQGAALRATVPSAMLVEGPFHAEAFAGVDLMVLSPGVPAQEPLVQQTLAQGVPLVSEIELFAWAVHQFTPRARVVAITGSNGKTTTTALTGALCRAAGQRTAIAGNIGPAALEALMAAVDSGTVPDLWVLELSSFQLDTTYSLNPDVAALLNLSEDHLDRYAGSMDAYTISKWRVFQGCGAMVLNRDDPRSLAARRPERRTVTFGLNSAPGPSDYGVVNDWIMRGAERLIALADLKLVGRHNAANAMAALALCDSIGIDLHAVLPTLAAFGGLPHRVEQVAEIDGVTYFDDSKGTNVGATLAALQGLGRRVAIILGGDGKGQDFSPLRDAIDRHACAVALIGRDAVVIATALGSSTLPMRHCCDMADAVRWCAEHAGPGDAVLLSPACASMDMYRNYAHRAEAFVDAVRLIEREIA